MASGSSKKPSSATSGAVSSFGSLFRVLQFKSVTSRTRRKKETAEETDKQDKQDKQDRKSKAVRRSMSFEPLKEAAHREAYRKKPLARRVQSHDNMQRIKITDVPLQSQMSQGQGHTEVKRMIMEIFF